MHVPPCALCTESASRRSNALRTHSLSSGLQENCQRHNGDGRLLTHRGRLLWETGEMDKISAACAMEWSIELEKGLRSKQPGQPIEAVLQIGPKLQQWSREPSVTMAISDMFGLVQGEDRLFANAILLRLADAFRSGDNHMRASVLKVFLMELKHRNKKGKHYNGILAKERVPNYMELLKRVKTVFDTGDVKSRALALRLLGCWADFAKDSAEIRYIILSSLESPHVLEVKASLFAVGCFCGLSEDFACIILELLINMVASHETSADVKQAAARVFSKMGCSSLIASRTYKACKKLVLGSSKEEFEAEMLLSLSKLSFKSILWIDEQVDLLLSFICGQYTSLVPAALKCLHFLSSRLHSSISVNVLTALCKMLDNPDFSLESQCKGLRILRKLCRVLPSLPDMDMQEFQKLALLLESAAQSPTFSKKYVALGMLVDISCILKRMPRGHWFHSLEQLSIPRMHPQDSLPDVALESAGKDPGTLPWHVSLLVIDQITLLAKQANGWSHVEGSTHTLTQSPDIAVASEMKQEFQTLLHLLLRLAGEYPTLGLMILNKVRCLIELLANMHIAFNGKAVVAEGEVSEMDIDAENPSSSLHGFIVSKVKEQDSTASGLILYLCKLLGALLEILDEAGVIMGEVYDSVKLLVESIWRIGFSDHKMRMIFSLLLNSCLMWHCFGSESNISGNINIDLNELKLATCSNKSHCDCWVNHEWMTLEFAKKMIAESNFWAVYKAGRDAACQDAWFAAMFAFRLLIKQTKSDPCRYWLESLVLYSGAESEIRLLLFPRQGIHLVSRLQVKGDGSVVEIGQADCQSVDFCAFREKLATAYNRVHSAERMLVAVATVDQPLYFQRWFLSLRAKVLETMVDILGLLNSLKDEHINEVGRDEESIEVSLPVLTQHTHSLVYHFSRISFRLKRLANEFDLLGTSFIGINYRSFRSISRLALNCSLLAFCTTFALYFPNQPAYNNIIAHILEKSEKCSPSMLIQDLIERLWHMDRKTSTDLQLFLTNMGEQPSNYLQPRTQISSCGHRERASLMVCRFAVLSVLRMQEKSKEVQNEKDLCHLLQAGLQLISDIVTKWMHLSFPTPQYFFRVRPCVGAELFVFNADMCNSDRISVPWGYQLSLNLCIQMKNTSSKCEIHVSKLYCIVAVKASNRLTKESGERKEQSQSGFQPGNTDEMVDLNEELLLYMRDNDQRMHHGVVSEDGLVKAFVRFQANERGQGFSTCLLDVSTFVEGYYQIIWKSCCIDSKGFYWSLLPLNAGPIFCIEKRSVTI